MQDSRHRNHDSTGGKGFECGDFSDRVVILDRKAKHDSADQRSRCTDTPCPCTDEQQDILEDRLSIGCCKLEDTQIGDCSLNHKAGYHCEQRRKLIPCFVGLDRQRKLDRADKCDQPTDTGDPSAEEFQTGLCQYIRRRTFFTFRRIRVR